MNKSLSIAIIGYGKMGQEIEKLALQQGHSIAAIIDNEEQWSLRHKDIAAADVAIEFTTPATAPGNIEKCFALNLPVVTGTTAWYDELPRIAALCTQNNQTLFYAPNFSIGVNIFFEVNRRLAQLMATQKEYRPHVSEIHHTKKLDAPSGTAVALANDILDYRKDLKRWVLGKQEADAGELQVDAFRIEQVTGTHVVSYFSDADNIEIKHVAHNRKGFTEGALMAALWVYDKKGIFTMKQMLNL